jgi:hypothetical protein
VRVARTPAPARRSRRCGANLRAISLKSHSPSSAGEPVVEYQ